VKQKKRSLLEGLVYTLFIGIAVATLFGFLGRFHWLFDLFSHFRVQYMQLCLIPFFIAMWKRRYRWAIAMVILVCINYSSVLPLYLGRPAPVQVKPIRAMLMNLNAGNGNTERVLESIKQFDPDVLLLEEVTPKWAHELEVLNPVYPHRIAEPQSGCFGIMLLSKHPMAHGKVVEIGTAGIPSITASLHFPQGEVFIIGTHPLPPINREYSQLRNVQLKALSKLSHQGKPVLLIGDLNSTPWSPHFRDLLEESGLQNSMKGFGHQPSWPSRMFFMRIPLDHMLYSNGITIHNRMIGRDVGSDHLPVIVDLSL